MPNEVPRACRNEAKSENPVRGPWVQHVPGDLFLHKPRIRFVLIKRSHNVVTIRPGVIAKLVLVVSAGVGVSRNVKPVLRPPLPVMF